LIIHFFRCSASHQGHPWVPSIQFNLLPEFHVIAAKKQAIWWDEVDECLSIASYRPRPQDSLFFGNKAIRVAFSLVLFLLATQKK